jgi:hypothetical protein
VTYIVSETFKALLTHHMIRAGLDGVRLAAKLGINPSTVRRWLVADSITRPRISTIFEMREPLGLTEQEVVLLLQAAHPETRPVPMETKIKLDTGDMPLETADGFLYVYRYAPDKFPSQWSLTVTEREDAIPGPILTMFATLPSIVRLPELYLPYKRPGLYEPQMVDRYMERLSQRQRDFGDRLRRSSIRHIYHKLSLIHLFASGRWRQVEVGQDLLRRQANHIAQLLEDHENFHVALAKDPVPLHVTIIGHRVALIEMIHYEHLGPVANVFGFETSRAEVVLALEEQFDSIWYSDRVLRNREEVKEWFRGEWRKDAAQLGARLGGVRGRGGAPEIT